MNSAESLRAALERNDLSQHGVAPEGADAMRTLAAADARIGSLEAERAALALTKQVLLAELEKARVENASLSRRVEALDSDHMRLSKDFHELQRTIAAVRAAADRGWRQAARNQRSLLAVAHALAEREESDPYSRDAAPEAWERAA